MDQSDLENVINFYQIFEIASDTNTVRQIDLSDADKKDVLAFVNKLANDAKYGESRRQGVFSDDSVVKRNLISSLSDDDNKLSILKIAEHLLFCEYEYNKKNGSFNKIRKGSLLVSSFERNGQSSILIAKIDVENFFETEQLKLLKGLPQNKGVYKTCLVNLRNDVLSDDIYLSDTNKSISHFWWDTFLKCDFIRDSQKNTDLSFSQLSSTLSQVNRVSPVDHAFLKGNLTSYFTTATNFDVQEMVERTVGNYKPEHKDVNSENIKDDLKKVCNNGKFDTSFEIDTTSIKSKLKRTIKIDDDIEVKIKSGDVSKIYHFEHQKTNFIAIKAKCGFGNFRKLDISND
ncbi:MULTISPECIES: nucleoid-associated protein [Vibrio harveyi group]|uniref:nucleoid-associated protein n=2 Tax=Vibrio TaxID=662 RepID=UPI000B7851F7|nr:MULTISPECIES: nucleoid-associated protein [Vibrio harveyi group]EGR3369252.1 hypothetical protein [Vibrio parahaemolyticus]EHH2553099.1 nucleoid-associated protein [Vibrio parahaemolyticus]EIE1186432.1 hypothetical protein [Vibrio parahaemolyticus]EJC6998465.1 hypothetical protein [Vibrio parahaemolyticus]EJC7154218.1 hypothetical protein [Vibrio parahaemolyticus]